LKISELDTLYPKGWTLRNTTRSGNNPAILITKELKAASLNYGDKVVIGVREDGVIEIRKVED